MQAVAVGWAGGDTETLEAAPTGLHDDCLGVGGEANERAEGPAEVYGLAV